MSPLHERLSWPWAFHSARGQFTLPVDVRIGDGRQFGQTRTLPGANPKGIPQLIWACIWACTSARPEID